MPTRKPDLIHANTSRVGRANKSEYRVRCNHCFDNGIETLLVSRTDRVFKHLKECRFFSGQLPDTLNEIMDSPKSLLRDVMAVVKGETAWKKSENDGDDVEDIQSDSEIVLNGDGTDNNIGDSTVSNSNKAAGSSTNATENTSPKEVAANISSSTNESSASSSSNLSSDPAKSSFSTFPSVVPKADKIPSMDRYPLIYANTTRVSKANKSEYLVRCNHCYENGIETLLVSRSSRVFRHLNECKYFNGTLPSLTTIKSKSNGQVQKSSSGVSAVKLASQPRSPSKPLVQGRPSQDWTKKFIDDLFQAFSSVGLPAIAIEDDSMR